MQNTIYGLAFDFIQQTRNNLVFSRNPSLQTGDLVNLHVKMMQSSTIPKTLPLEVEEIDFNVRLRYDISSKKMLHHMVEGLKLSLYDYFHILFQIATALDDSKIYMLNENNYVIDEKFIFVGKDYSDIYLTYLPMKELPDKGSLQSDLLLLAANLAEHIQLAHGEGIQEALNYLKDSNFTLAGFKQMLVQNMNKLSAAKKDVLPNHPLVTSESSVSKMQSKDTQKEKSNLPQRPRKTKLSNIVPIKKESNPKETKNRTVLESRIKTITYLITLLIAAFVWKAFLDYPSEGLLYICIGVTLLAANGAFVFLNIIYPRMSLAYNESNNFDVTPVLPVVANQINLGATPPVANRSNANKEASSPLPHKVNNSIDSSHDYYKNLANQTTLFAVTDETTYLSDTSNTEAKEAIKYFLEVDQNGRKVEIEITQDRFVIGRNADVVHFVLDDTNVSRTHLEILKDEDGFHIKDLGSLNGTKLNAQSLVAYKAYPIHDGDVITIANKEMIFKKIPS